MLLNAEHISSAAAWMLHAVEQGPLLHACSLQATADGVGMGGVSTAAHASASPAPTVSWSTVLASMAKAGDKCILGLS